jgi:phosphohistidine phosphatase
VFDLGNPAPSKGDSDTPALSPAAERGSLHRVPQTPHPTGRPGRVLSCHDTAAESGPESWSTSRAGTVSTARSVAIAPPATAEVVFSRETSVAGFLDTLLSETRFSIEAALHQLNNPRLVRALEKASQRGVRVRLLLDRTKFEELNSSSPNLGNNGLCLRLLNGRLGPASRMHHKFALLDGRAVVTGSYNWTVGSDEQNYENLIILRGPAQVIAYRREFRALWHQGSPAAQRTASDVRPGAREDKAATEAVRSAQSASQQEGFRIYLMRHGQAGPRGKTPARAGRSRALTAEGKKRIGEIAAGLVRVGFAVDAIVTSPLRSALETAQIVGALLQPKVAVEPCEALLPEGSLDDAIRFLRRRPELRQVLLVGHEPALSRLAARLLDSKEGANLKLKKGGCCLLAFEDPPEPGKGRLIWWLPPRLLRKLG